MGDDANQTSDKVLLDCNVFESGGGPDQEVVIAKRSSGLVMKELTNHGSWEERPLGQEEWDKRDLELRRDRWDGPDTVNRLYKDDEGAWRNESLSDGFNVYGYAYCFKDES